jgi:hydroxyethylthiazole kinase-like uncharacterized protein yjeF
MIALLTAEEMRALDRKTIEDIGIESAVLMETAGVCVADSVESLFDERGFEDGPVLVLAGIGNNGGDALVAARHLVNRAILVTILVIGDLSRASQDFRRQLDILERLDLEVLVYSGEEPTEMIESMLDVHEVVVDGLFGTGLSRPISGVYAKVIQAVNESELAVVAIDLPSGVNADTGQIMGEAILATRTVGFAFPKIGHTLYPGRSCTGDFVLADIGIPYVLVDEIEPMAAQIDEEILDLAIPSRVADSHKGSYGHLLVIAGTPQRPGSALLAARAGLKSGAGLVTLGSDAVTVGRLAPVLESLMGLDLGETRLESEQVLSHLQGFTALVIGPSLLGDDHLSALIKTVLMQAKLPVVLDAGALDALGRDPDWLKDRDYPTIISPHPGEMSRLLGLDTALVQADRVGIARSYAARYRCTVVLKGASTVIADPDGEVGIVLAGNPGMATGGTGDVLAGLIGGLLAQGVAAPFAARAGVYLHGRAGDVAAERVGEAGLTASDLLAAVMVERR